MDDPAVCIRVAATHARNNPGHLSTTFVVNGVIAVDAGAIASRLSLKEQAAIRHVLITHAHLDHVHELAQFLDNVQTARDLASPPLEIAVHGEAVTLKSIRDHIFGGLWPNVVDDSVGFATLCPLEALGDDILTLAGFQISAVRTIHRVPTVGYVFEKDGHGFAILADTGFGRQLVASISRAKINFIAIELSYPNRLAAWAEEHGHLTPRLLLQAVRPLIEGPRPVRVVIHHLKPAFAEEILDELRGLPVPIHVAEDGDEFILDG